LRHNEGAGFRAFFIAKMKPTDKPAYKIPESVLVVVYTAAREVLLIERTGNPGYWQSVTGSKDSLEEDLFDTAIRELFEETGIAVGGAGEHAVPHTVPRSALADWELSNVYDIYPVWRHRYAPGVTRNTEHVFGLEVPAGMPVVLSPREHTDYVWLPYREAADKCFSPSNAEAILQLPARLT
jgi:dATP pyrophosphohydrolase